MMTLHFSLQKVFFVYFLFLSGSFQVDIHIFPYVASTCVLYDPKFFPVFSVYS